MTNSIDFHGDTSLHFSRVNPLTAGYYPGEPYHSFTEVKETLVVSHHIPTIPEALYLEAPSPTQVTGGHILSHECQCLPIPYESAPEDSPLPTLRYFHRDAETSHPEEGQDL